MKITWGGAIIVIIAVVLVSLFAYALHDMEKTRSKNRSCIDEYPLNSCELYKCRAENSNWIPDITFNNRNYEICKIIINKNMSFNESLPLLNSIKPEK